MLIKTILNKIEKFQSFIYGFRSTEHLQIALYHVLGALPEPKTIHRFC